MIGTMMKTKTMLIRKGNWVTSLVKYVLGLSIIMLIPMFVIILALSVSYQSNNTKPEVETAEDLPDLWNGHPVKTRRFN